jgi:NTP pyrophosphatase (non-canonical NTP hydrolase)
MDFQLYQSMASRTECDQTRSLARMANLPMAHTKGLGPSQLRQIRLNHGVLGLTGEVGELAAALEKWVYYGQDLDEGNVAEEVGDCLWYLSLVCSALGLSLEDCAAANIRKLKARYPEAYSDERAGVRDLDAERKALGALGHHQTAAALPGPQIQYDPEVERQAREEADRRAAVARRQMEKMAPEQATIYWACECGQTNSCIVCNCSKCGLRRGEPGAQPLPDWLCDCGHINLPTDTRCAKCGCHPSPWDREKSVEKHQKHLKAQIAERQRKITDMSRPPDQPNPFGYNEGEGS